MAAIPITRSRHIVPFAKFMSKAGAPLYTLLRQAGLPEGCIDDPDMLVPSTAAFRFRESCARNAGLPNIGIDATEHLQVADLGVLGQTLLQAPTLYRLLSDFQRLYRTETSSLDIDISQQKNGDVVLSHRLLLDGELEEWNSNLYVLQWLLKIVRLVDPDWTPASIRMSSHATKERQLAIERLGVNAMSFDRDRTGFLIPCSLLAHPLVNRTRQKQADPDSSESRLWSQAPGGTFTSTLRQILQAYASDRWLTATEAAEVIGTSTRSMQRRLSEERATFTDISLKIHAEIAADLLANTDVKLSEIAAHLGYTAQGNFTRAFRHWAGMTPYEFRKHKRNITTH